jgi:hypothetical protein
LATHCACAGDFSPRRWEPAPIVFPRAVEFQSHREFFSSMSTGCPHLKRARWSSLRPGVFLLWYVSFSNFQPALVEFLPGSFSLLCVQRRHIRICFGLPVHRSLVRPRVVPRDGVNTDLVQIHLSTNSTRAAAMRRGVDGSASSGDARRCSSIAGGVRGRLGLDLNLSSRQPPGQLARRRRSSGRRRVVRLRP